MKYTCINDMSRTYTKTLLIPLDSENNPLIALKTENSQYMLDKIEKGFWKKNPYVMP